MKKLFIIVLFLSNPALAQNCQVIRDRVFCDNGETTNQIGNYQFNNNGTSCMNINGFITCNGQ